MKFLVITLMDDGTLDALADFNTDDLHIVVINQKERWTDSPVVGKATDSELSEWIAVHRNEGFEDRNP